MLSDGVKMMVEGCRQLTVLQIANCGGVNNECLEAVSQLEQLVRFDVSSCGFVSDIGICSLVNDGLLLNLANLTLSHCSHLTDLAMLALSQHCHNLQCLELSGCRLVSDEGLIPLVQNCFKIRKLDLEECVLITDNLVSAISNHLSSTIEHLIFSFCDLINDTAILHLIRSCNLKTLEIDNCSRISDVLVSDLASQLPSTLRRINLFDCRGVSFSAIKSLQNSTHTAIDVITAAQNLKALKMEKRRVNKNIRKDKGKAPGTVFCKKCKLASRCISICKAKCEACYSSYSSTFKKISYDSACRNILEETSANLILSHQTRNSAQFYMPGSFFRLNCSLDMIQRSRILLEDQMLSSDSYNEYTDSFTNSDALDSTQEDTITFATQLIDEEITNCQENAKRNQIGNLHSILKQGSSSKIGESSGFSAGVCSMSPIIEQLGPQLANNQIEINNTANGMNGDESIEELDENSDFVLPHPWSALRQDYIPLRIGSFHTALEINHEDDVNETTDVRIRHFGRQLSRCSIL
ncbi:hypothetical protein HK096_006501 [Nowakowskiella sp. JEL0078]|nr:hypothetical protein HK096_006501 [Nowakowskiella sp. JEL0078]